MAEGAIRITFSIQTGSGSPVRVGSPSTVVVSPAPKILSVR